MRNFRDLEIWQEAVNVAVISLRLIKGFPQEDKFIIGKQIQRSAISIASNIAEGCSRNTKKEFIRFLNIALGSAFELETQLLIAKELKIISDEKYDYIHHRLEVLQKRMNASVQPCNQEPDFICQVMCYRTEMNSTSPNRNSYTANMLIRQF